MSAPAGKRLALTAAAASAAVLAMTCMAFAAVPLYKAFCQATGYGGTTQTASAAPTRVLDRSIEVRFDSNVSTDLPISFAPAERAQTLKIGETGLAFFRVRNLSNAPVTARATYNVAPHAAGPYFVKLECFCFQDRVLAPGEEVELPVVFFVAPEIAEDPDVARTGVITLSYTYFRSAVGASG